MEMSWESNRVVLPCTGFHSVRQFSKVQKFYQCGFLLVQQLAQRHGRPSFMVVPEIVCSRGCSAAPLTWGMWFHVYMCRCFWEYRQEYETDTDTESISFWEYRQEYETVTDTESISFWEYRQEYETDTDTESISFVLLSVLLTASGLDSEEFTEIVFRGGC